MDTEKKCYTDARTGALWGKMKKNKLIIIGFYIFIVFLLSSCGATTTALLFSWVHTIDHNAEYFKIDQYGNTAER
ncbi:MAG: hypothetical protein J5747_01610, partial [Spirochaetaceae bacterium]|nr:hypothetical protein [Spirochaetaceae bacterium]